MSKVTPEDVLHSVAECINSGNLDSLMMIYESDAEFLHVIISLAILLFTAKIFAEIFHRLKMPIVLGELLAGIIIGPFALYLLIQKNKI